MPRRKSTVDTPEPLTRYTRTWYPPRPRRNARPKYQSRHYNDLADLVQTMREDLELVGLLAPTASIDLADLARYIAARLQADNPRFSRTRFLQACGYDV